MEKKTEADGWKTGSPASCRSEIVGLGCGERTKTIRMTLGQVMIPDLLGVECYQVEDFLHPQLVPRLRSHKVVVSWLISEAGPETRK